MNLENYMFHQGNGVSNNSAINLESLDSYFMFLQRNEVSSNNSAENLQNLDSLFHQANGVSNNVDPRIPVVPEGSYMQRPYHQGYQSSNCMESISPVFTQEAPVMMQRSNLPPTTEMQMNQMPFDMNLLPEQSVHQQLDFILPQVQRNQMQSANRLEQVNNHRVVLHRQSMQSFSPNPSEMTRNQSGNEWHPSLGLLKLFPSKKISQIPDPIPTYQIQDNQAQSADWAETIGLYSNILQDTPKRNVQPNDCESSMQGGAGLGINECLTQNANSYLNYGRDVHNGNLQLQVDMRVANNAPHGSPADGELYRGTYPTGMLQAANSSYFHTGNNWEQQSATSVQQQQERAFLGINQTGSTPEWKSSDGFHISSQALYNLVSPSHVEYDATSSTTNYLKNPPVTPEKYSQLRFSQPSATEHSFVIDRWSPEKDKQDSVPQIREGGEIYSNQPSTGVIASPSNSTSLKEKVPEDGTSGGIDLSATPQQKTPKRKKHRPKVIKEGKTKKTPKSAASKTEVSTDKPTGKRKYVRRKDLGTSSPQDNEKGEFEASTSRSETRPCRRELNFDSEQKEQEEPQEINKNVYLHGSHLNSNSQETTPTTGLDSVSVVPTAKKGQQNTDDAGKLQSRNSWSLIAAANQRIANETPRLERKAHLSTSMDHVNPRNIKTQNGIPYQSNEYEHRQENRVYLEAEQTAIQENLARAMYQAEMQQLSRCRTDHISGCQVIKDKTGQKRDYINISEKASYQYSSEHDNTGRITEICNLGAYKRMKHDEFHRAPCNLPSLTATARNGQWQVQCSNTVSCNSETEVYGNRNNRENVMGNQYYNAMAVGNNYQKSRALVAEIMHRNRMMREAFQQKTETHGSNLLTGATYRNMESLPQRVPVTIVGNTTTISRSDADRKSQTVKVKSTIPEVSGEKVLPRKYMETANLHSSRKARGQKEVKTHANTIDEIIRRLEALGISDQQQGAIVPYEGHGTLVPFEAFVPIRRRKPRPRVNLDSETITQWNLLMGKTGNEGEETGLDKEKWWESEREVFRGRVDTFIARMHLVQGDRRFSRWKGSVVDSVIGVFLTQNVSDHLSSSAFMHLAARFPLGSATTEMTSSRTRTSAWVEEPEVQIIDPDGTIAFPLGTLTQPLHKQDSTASSQYFEQQSENLITATGGNIAEDNNGTTKDVVSSQNSSDSIILQASEDMRNSSDSEVEYQTIFPSSNNQNQNKKKEIIDTFQQNQNHTRSDFPSYQQIDNLSCLGSNPKLNIRKNVGAGSIDLNALSSEESSDPSTSLTTLNLISNSRVTETYFSVSTGNQFHPSEDEATKSQGVFPVRVDPESVPVGLSGSTTKETGIPIYKGTSTDRYSTASHNVNSQLVYDFGSFQPSTSINQTQSLRSFHFESSTAGDAQRPDEAHSKQQTGNLFPTGENFGSAGSKISNERRKKNDINKMKEVDWDELRKEVLRLGTKKERDKDKMDSMDYEALCNADVNRISDAIRERGMNNMLAERIKAFLNRLVKDHGSIDLEWLRDVPPDKAKDYLLSVRGLGLKSVECIRLLSLHSMAFPVDTNVGRIAVRLGWVPLQPLPESLQLHLLEMYPILESIQKYIWPRLCKLDQRTLYELHYQMITFGKVFCTKSRPNCNVCPMKGECRHFASAFASARLALPGPEEKGMVNFSNPIAPTEDHRTIMEPLLLASSGSSLDRGLLHFSSECEPIVEEPTTPEICPGEAESDIEDLLSEDPNEIPVIKFSLEALKANVQNIIQEQNLEISEGDLSKALVALNPATASIPAPKLKNVSRLRTEHQVYELPDWHPIIKEMDGREPDDPSPYLLAIWTPGETADSTQPNEHKCALSGSGRLCDEKTCFQCNSVREADSQMVRGTILIPCRTAMRGSFPLNGTYFQVNEVFADHESSLNPIAVPRESLWHLRRRTAYFGTSVTTIFRGMPIEEIQYCFWRGFVCVRGFDRKFRAPRPLMARLHFAASRLAKNKKEGK